MTQQATAKTGQPTDRTFEEMLTAWQTGDDPAWAELMAAWLQTPAAPRSTETVTRLIKHLDSK
jgi:hypothetical protein